MRNLFYIPSVRRLNIISKTILSNLYCCRTIFSRYDLMVSVCHGTNGRGACSYIYSFLSNKGQVWDETCQRPNRPRRWLLLRRPYADCLCCPDTESLGREIIAGKFCAERPACKRDRYWFVDRPQKTVLSHSLVLHCCRHISQYSALCHKL